MAHQDTLPNACSVCGEAASVRCIACSDVKYPNKISASTFYCSKDCQTKGWPSIRRIARPFRPAKSSSVQASFFRKHFSPLELRLLISKSRRWRSSAMVHCAFSMHPSRLRRPRSDLFLTSLDSTRKPSKPYSPGMLATMSFTV